MEWIRREQTAQGLGGPKQMGLPDYLSWRARPHAIR